MKKETQLTDLGNDCYALRAPIPVQLTVYKTGRIRAIAGALDCRGFGRTTEEEALDGLKVDIISLYEHCRELAPQDKLGWEMLAWYHQAQKIIEEVSE